MSCSCRAAIWRSFVQGLAQVHNVPGHNGTARLWRAWPVQPSSASPFRGFTASSGWRQESSVSAAASEDSIEPSNDVATDRAEPEPAVAAKKPARQDRKKDKKAEDAATSPERSKSRTSETSALPTTPKRQRKTHDHSAQTDTAVAQPPKTPAWQTQKAALKEKFPEGWKPRKRLSPDALAGIRALNAQFPDTYTTKALADKFQVSSESIRRILKGGWTPSAEEEQDRQERWFRRGMQVWERQAAVGVKPPRKWRREGIVRDSAWHDRKKGAARREREWEEQEKEVERAKRNYGGSGRGGDGDGERGGWRGGGGNGRRGE